MYGKRCRGGVLTLAQQEAQGGVLPLIQFFYASYARNKCRVMGEVSVRGEERLRGEAGERGVCVVCVEELVILSLDEDTKFFVKLHNKAEVTIEVIVHISLVEKRVYTLPSNTKYEIYLEKGKE